VKIYSKNIINGYLEDRFGKHETQILTSKEYNPSFHLAWSDLPKDTESMALIFLDYDAIPVCGFPWIHWTVANIDPKLKELPENASMEMKLLEGVTSWNSGLLSKEHRLDKEDATGYGGCAPPDQAHRYTIYMYALNKKLNLSRGFYANELLKAMDGYILDQATLHCMYRS